ncbi:MAG: hypothetical protein IJ074_05170 [Clostridia bacterium]|nr:hypothetical protein [Clostridia bacterium]MBQ8972453.1 hypothetical protein [Clostridia bacterium]
MDQEKFYEAEEQEPRNESQNTVGSTDEVNDMVYFLELLKNLRKLIEQGSRVPLTGKALVDVEKCQIVLDEMDRNLPDAIQYGMQMYEEKARIMGDAEDTAISRVTTAELKAKKAIENARRDASQIVMDAEEEARAILDDASDRAAQMVSESEVVRQAREEARTIKSDARVEAGEVRLKASHDVYQMLSDVEGNLDETLKEIRRLRSETTTESE